MTQTTLISSERVLNLKKFLDLDLETKLLLRVTWNPENHENDVIVHKNVLAYAIQVQNKASKDLKLKYFVMNFL
jgi:hypothetical protein